MITDLANLGPSLRTTPGLEKGSAKANKPTASPQAGKTPEAASSFGDILKQTAGDAKKPAAKAPEDSVKINLAKPGPAPVDNKAPPTVDSEKVAKVAQNTSEPRTAQKTQQDWDETGSVQDKVNQATIGEKTESPQASPREQVMLKFMDSMESEFGVPPIKIVEAMALLPESEQLASPEDSAAQVISQLNIPEEQKPEALALYMGMLAQLQQPAMSKPVIPMIAAGGAAVTAAPLMAIGKQDKRAALNASLDKMNNQFFMPGQAPMKTSAVTDRLMSSEKMAPDIEKLTPQTFSKETVDWQAQESLMPKYSQQAKPAALSTKALAEQMQQMQAVDPNGPEAQLLTQKLAALGMAAGILDQGLKADPQNAQALNIEQAGGPQAAALGALSAAGLAGIASGESSMEDTGADSDRGNSSGGNSDSFMVNHPSGHTSHTRTEAPQKGDFASAMSGAALAGSAGKSENADLSKASVQQIMNQAQYLIKKGGGESKIQMSPEGLGQLHLKVAVTDGKVNLEMTAENKETKKLLESSLNDLRSSLGQHKMTVDQVKVDVGNQLSSDSQNPDKQDAQRQMDMNRQQKDQTREFWNEFQNQGQSRSSFTENPALRGYGGSRKPEALTPDSNSRTVAEKRFSGSGKGRGLDLVA